MKEMLSPLRLNELLALKINSSITNATLSPSFTIAESFSLNFNDWLVGMRGVGNHSLLITINVQI
jgi:hypothetical protein